MAIFNSRKFRRIFVICATLLTSFAANAINESPQTFTLDGQLYQTGSSMPLLDNSAKLTVQIINPSGNCLLYEEQQTVNTMNAEGHFTINVGSPVGSVKRTVNDPGRTMTQIFQNIAAITANNMPSQTCTGGTYTPSPGAVRYFRLIVTPSTTNIPDTLSPDIVMDSVPNAVIAQSVQGLERSSILQTNNVAPVSLNQGNLEALFTAPAYSNLQAILAGNFVRQDSSGATLPSYASTPAGVSTGDMWFDSTTGQIKYQTSGGVQTVGTATGGITSLTLSSSMSGNGTVAAVISNGSASIDLSNTGVTPGSYAKVTVDAKGRVSAGISLAESDLPAIVTPGKVSGNAITSGTISGSTGINTSGNLISSGTVSGLTVQATNLRIYNGSNYTQFQAAVQSGDNTFTWPATTGSAGQLLSTDGNGILSWVSTTLPSLLSGKIWVGNGSNVATAVDLSGDATINNAGVLTLANTVSAGTYQKVTVDSKGRAIAGTNLTAADISAALGYQPVNRGGDTMAGSISMGGYNITNAGNIEQAGGKYFGLSGQSSDPSTAGWGASEKGRAWFNTTSNEVKYWDGAAVKALGVAGSGLTNLGGQTGSTQTFAVGTSGTAFNISSASNTHTFNIPMASTASVTAGLISKTDYDNFNTKLGTTTQFAGDVSGTYNATVVQQLQGKAITAGSVSGQVMIYNGTAWVNSVVSGDATLAHDGNLVLNKVPVAKGGTNATSFGNNRIIASNGTGTALQDFTCGLNQVISFDASGNATCAAVSTLGGFILNGGNSFAGDISIGSNDNNALKFKVNNSVAMSISQSGNVGIGTIAPSAALDVSGALNMNGIAAPTVSPSNEGRIYFDRAANKFKISQNGAAYVDLVGAGSINSIAGQTGGAQALAISVDNSVLLPTITSASDTHTWKFPMASNAGTTAGLLNKTDYDTFNNKLGATTQFAGDVSGTYNSTVVQKIQGKDITAGSVSGQMMIYNGTAWVNAVVSGDATIAHDGNLVLANTVSAGTYQKITVDSKGRAVAGSNLTAADISAALGYQPVNRGGDTMAGSISMGGYNITNAGDIAQAGGKYFGLSGQSSDPSTAGWGAAEKGRTWFNSTSNEVKYWDGSSVKALGVAGSGLTSLGGQTGSTQTFAVGTAGTALNISSASNVHTINIPLASTASVTGGLISKTDYDNFNTKLGTTTQFAGDVSGTYNATIVQQIQGKAVTAGSVSGQVMIYNGTAWVNSVVSGDATLAHDGNLVLNKVPVSKGGTNATTFGNNRIIASNGTGTALQDFTCGLNQVISFDASGNATCAAVSTLGGFILNGGNSFAGDISIGSNDNNALKFKVNNTTAMTISQSGYVGIGTTSPAGVLDVQGGTAAASAHGTNIVLQAQAPGSGNQNGGNIVLTPGGKTGTGANGGVLIGYTTQPSWLMPNSLYAAGTLYSAGNQVSNSGAYSWGTGSSKWSGVGSTNSSDYIAASTNTVERLRIDGSGNIGIGTSAPSSALDVSGALTAQGMSSAPGVSASNTGRIYYDYATNKFKISQNGAAYVDLVGAGSITSVGGQTGAAQSLAISVDNSVATPTITSASNTHTWKIPMASNSGTTAGLLSKTDYDSFTNKLDASSVFAGDVSGAYNATVVQKIQGKAITAGSVSGQMMIYNGTSWVNSVMSGAGTLDYAGQLTLNTVPVSKGGTAATSFGNNRIIASNGTGTALQDFTCPLNQVISFDASGNSVCANVSSLFGAIINGGNTTGGDISIGTNDNKALAFKTNNSTAMTISQNGNVGIGVASASYPLDVMGTGQVFKSTQNGGSGQQVFSLARINHASQNNEWSYYISNGAGVLANGSLSIFPTTNADMSLDARNAGYKQLVLKASGNVGIGTAAPSSALDVSGALTAQGMSSAPAVSDVNTGRIYYDYASNKFKISQNGTAYVDLVSSASGDVLNNGNTLGAPLTVGTNDAQPLKLEVNNTTALTISQSGYVGIGTNNPSAPLEVTTMLMAGSTAYSADAAIYATSSQGYGIPLVVRGNAGAMVQFKDTSGVLKDWSAGILDDTSAFTIFENRGIAVSAGTERFRIAAGGNVGIGTTAPSSALDVSGAITAEGMSSAPGVSASNTGRIYYDYSANKFKVSQNGGAYTDLVGVSGTISVGQGGTNATSFAANGVIVSNGTGSALTALNCSSGQVITFDASGYAICGSGGGSNFANGGNSFGADATLGTNDNKALNFEVNNTTAMTISQGGNVGIGTTNPSGKLTVNGGDLNLISGNGSAIQIIDGAGFSSVRLKNGYNSTWYPSLDFANGGAYDTTLYRGGAGILRTPGTLVVDSKIGIGVASPSTALDISGAVTALGMSSAPSVSSSNTGRIYYDYSANKFKVSQNGGAYVDLISSATGILNGGNTTGADISIGTNDNKALGFKVNNATAMTISQGGYVGIGTATPSALLHVYQPGSPYIPAKFEGNCSGCVVETMIGNLAGITGGSSAKLTFNISGPGQVAGVSGIGTSAQDGALTFTTLTTGAGTEKMRVDSSGNVGIGTTSARAKLDVNGTIATKAATSNGSSTIDGSAGNIQYTTANCGAFQFNNLKDGASYMFVVQGATSTTCSFTAYSDAGSTALTVHMPPDHAATTASKHTIYNLTVVGTHVYVAWTPGY